MENKPSHTGLGLVLGAALGTVAGVVAGHVGVWLALGVAIGMVLGASFRRREQGCPQCAAVHKGHIHNINEGKADSRELTAAGWKQTS